MTTPTTTQYPYLLGPVSSYDDLRQAQYRTDIDQLIAVFYRDSLGDGYGGFFYWDQNNINADNNNDIIKPAILANGDEGRWIKLYSNAAGSNTQLPTATAVGQILISVDGYTFDVRQPLVSPNDGWLANNNGELLWEGIE